MSRRHTFCQGGDTVFCQDAHLFCQAADAPGKTKAINPSCVSAQDQKQKRYLSGYANRKDTVFAFMKKHDIIEILIPIERNTIAVLIVMTGTHDTAIVPNMIIVSRFFEYVKDGIYYITGTETVTEPY